MQSFIERAETSATPHGLRPGSLMTILKGCKMTFKIGDIVQLKSGGPKMTIISGPDGVNNRYNTIWFAGAKHEKGIFPVDALINATEEIKK
jgi:uncharacterized protein YodC (DUF2158 family)